MAEAAASAAPAPPAAPPPARQVAQVTIALALSPGQAPRLVVALEPAALGRVEIRIERTTAGAPAAVRVLAERPETLILLQRDARELDRALQQAGVAVAEGGLQFGLAAGGQGDHPGPGGGGSRPGGGGRGLRLPAAAARPAAPRLLSLALLDIAV